MLQHTQYGPRLLHHFHVLWNCIGGDLFWGRSPSIIWAEPCVLCRSEPSWTHCSSSLRLCWVVVSVGVSSYLASHTSAKICGGTRQWKWNTLMLRIIRWWNEKRLVDPGFEFCGFHFVCVKSFWHLRHVQVARNAHILIDDRVITDGMLHPLPLLVIP